MEPPSPYRIAISNESGRRLPAATLQSVCLVALAKAGLPPGELSLRFCRNAEIQALNATFRGIDEPTDVLSFPAAGLPIPEGVPRPLGDLAISVEFAEHQAASRGSGLESELGYLAIHGILHLAGMDDEFEPDRTDMLQAMEEIGRAAGLPELGDWQTLDLAGAKP